MSEVSRMAIFTLKKRTEKSIDVRMFDNSCEDIVHSQISWYNWFGEKNG